MPNIEPHATFEQSTQRIEERLREDFGALLTQADLARILRYPTVQAIRKARVRGNLAIPMFRLPMRRGWFATARAVAEFLASLDQRPPISREEAVILLKCPLASAVQQAHPPEALPEPLYRRPDQAHPSGKQADTEKVLTERLEPPRTSMQGTTTEEEVS